jgi:hypothetical protein
LRLHKNIDPSHLTDLRQIGWITSDNVTSNDKMMARLEDELDTIEHEWKASDRRVRYACRARRWDNY